MVCSYSCFATEANTPLLFTKFVYVANEQTYVNHHFTFAIRINVIIFNQFVQTSNLHHSFQIYTPFSKIISSPLRAIRKRMNKSKLTTIWRLFQYQLHRPRQGDKSLYNEVLHLKYVRILLHCTMKYLELFRILPGSSEG